MGDNLSPREVRPAQEPTRAEALREREFMERLLASMPDGLSVLDTQGVHVDVNPALCRMTGFARNELIGVGPPHPYWPPEEYGAIESAFQETLAGRSSELALTFMRKDGERFPVLVYPSSVEDEAGEVLSRFATVKDMTEHNRAREVLARSERRLKKLESLGVLAGGLAHDFNNLLTVIQGNVELVKAELPAASEAQARLESVVLAAHSAGNLTNQMLAYSGRGQFEAQAVDLSAIVANMTRFLVGSVAKEAELKLELSGSQTGIEADAAQIEQVVTNLVTNASESLANRPGQVRVKTGALECDRAFLDAFPGSPGLAEGRYALLQVSDTGCGIEGDTLERIFDPFFSTKFPGRGLGLAAVLGIVHSHRGAIRVESEVGQGTTVVALFSACDALPAPAAVDVGVEGGWRGSGTILLVEDQDMLRAHATEMLKSLGFSVLQAAGGAEAVDLFRRRQEQIACVLLDYKTPRMDGQETLREIRGIRAGVPVLLASGYTQKKAASGLSEKGLTGFVPKPYGPATLRIKLRELLGQ